MKAWIAGGLALLAASAAQAQQPYGPCVVGSTTVLGCYKVDGTTITVTSGVISAAAGASGINQLTGDVTAGPGTGSQAATLANTNTARSDLGLNVNGAVKVTTAGAASQAACGDLSGSGPYCVAAQGQLPGTTTNDSANAGNLSETAIGYTVDGSSATVTITNASPGVISWTGHSNGCAGAIYLTTTGALPTGLSANTPYYVTCGASLQTNSFQVSTTVDNAIAGTSINTSSAGSGTQTGHQGLFMTTATQQNVTGVKLTAGNWVCTGALDMLPNSATTITQQIGNVNSVSATLGSPTASVTTLAQRWQDLSSYAAAAITERTVPMPPLEVKLSAGANVYLVAFMTFATNNYITGGNVICRRTR